MLSNSKWDSSTTWTLSIDLQDTVFRQSEFAIVNGNAQDYRREHTLSLKDL
jgi:vacuolar protein sorting-associated protein 13A/C